MPTMLACPARTAALTALGVLCILIAPLAVAGSAAAASSTGDAQLRSDVSVYSAAFLGGRPQAAFALLTPRCRSAIGYSTFAQIVAGAHELYGLLRIRSYQASVDGSRARVTYRYAIGRLDQVREPWARRGGHWHNNEC